MDGQKGVDKYVVRATYEEIMEDCKISRIALKTKVCCRIDLDASVMYNESFLSRWIFTLLQRVLDY